MIFGKRTYTSYFILVAVLTLVPMAAAQKRTVGNNIDVGAFRLHVQIQTGRVNVQNMMGSAAPALPVTQLLAEFATWNPTTRTVAINVSVRNIGLRSLFAPRAVFSSVAPPMVTALNPDLGSGSGSWAWNYEGVVGSNTITPGKEWRFQVGPQMAFQVDIRLLAGVPLPPGEGATITAPDGTSVTVAPNSMPYEALVDVAAVQPAALVAPTGTLQVVGAVSITLEPAIFNYQMLPPSKPLALSIPASGGISTSHFVVAQQLLTASLSGMPGLKQQFVPVDTGVLSGAQIVTTGAVFAGVSGPGVYAFFANPGSGFITGTVTQGGVPRPGVVVSNNTNTLVAVTNTVGRYTLYISGGQFTATAFDPLRGSGGSASGIISISGSTVNAGIALTPLPAAPNVLDGVRNGGFEEGTPGGFWSSTGAASVVQQLGPTSTGVVIRPTEGRYMANINTGASAVGGIGSSLKQRFRVPAGVQTLQIDYNFVSEEFPEFVGSIFDDSFQATITVLDGSANPQTTFARVSVNESGGFELIGDCFFPGGDTTCGQTGWRTASVDLSAYAGTNQLIEVSLLFAAVDAGDSVYDTHVLLDNIRFSTLWIDAKIITGAAATPSLIHSHVRSANEILSQAGLNIRLREPSFVNNSDFLEILGAGVPCGFLNLFTCAPPEALRLLNTSRSNTNTDLNVYYVRSRSVPGHTGIAGEAFPPENYRDISIYENAGVFMTNLGIGQTLAHEVGHILLNARDDHTPNDATNFMYNFLSENAIIVSRTQSSNINRKGAPLLVQ